MFGLYRALLRVSRPLIIRTLYRRRDRGKEDATRITERFGVPGAARPDAPLVWLHGASVGESLSLIPLVEKISEERPDIAFLVTTGTVTSAELMAKRLPARAIHQFVPVDHPDWVARFLDYWRPDLAIWAESEFWPNLVMMTAERAIPMALVNARMSPRSTARWRIVQPMARRLLSSFAVCLAQNQETADALSALGARNVELTGNLKNAAGPLDVDEGMLRSLEDLLDVRPRWLALSTHEGEEEIAARVHLVLREVFPGLLTVIVPRHPARAEAVAERLKEMKLKVARRSRNESPGADIDVYLVDTMGEMGLVCRIGRIAFVGKSLTESGGHNPLEPARLDCAILHGPRIANFSDAFGALDRAGGAHQVRDEAELMAAVEGLLAEPARAEAMAAAAVRVSRGGSDVLTRIIAALGPLMPPDEEQRSRASA